MIALLALATAELEAAASRPVAEVEAVLSQIALALHALPDVASGCAPEDRPALRSQVLAFRASLEKLNKAMARGESVLRSYCRQSGAYCEEYAPGGLAGQTRDPAFFALQV